MHVSLNAPLTMPAPRAHRKQAKAFAKPNHLQQTSGGWAETRRDS
jgi:hypothetical protein